MENLQKIVHELAFGSRKTKIQLIRELAGEEFETLDDVFKLAEKNEIQINGNLSSLFDYYLNEINE
jgi:hypothetical protein